MSFYSVNKENLQNVSGNGGNIFKSGVYDITIERVEYSITQSGSRKVDIAYILDNGSKGYLWNLILFNSNGEENFQKVHFDSLLTVLGISELKNPVKEKFTTNKGEKKEALILKELTNKKVTLIVKSEYSFYNGKVYKNMKIHGVFRTSDKASAWEIVNNGQIGERFEKEQPYIEEIILGKGVTQQMVDSFEEEQKQNFKNKNNTNTQERQIDLNQINKEDNDTLPF